MAHQKIYFLQVWQKRLGVILIQSHWTAMVVLAVVVIYLFIYWFESERDINLRCSIYLGTHWLTPGISGWCCNQRSYRARAVVLFLFDNLRERGPLSLTSQLGITRFKTPSAPECSGTPAENRWHGPVACLRTGVWPTSSVQGQRANISDFEGQEAKSRISYKRYTVRRMDFFF